MDTLDGTEWDVIISGTGLRQSLLALALSRSHKKILHIDRNEYYGGNEAALSLSEVETWARRYAEPTEASNEATFANAVVEKAEDGNDDGPKLSFPRAYSLALAPQLIYSLSTLLPALVEAKVHNQLEFQAVGSWFVVEQKENDQKKFVKVPNGREDIFQDTSFDLRAKRALMKFIRFVGDLDDESESWAEVKSKPFPTLLEENFGLTAAFHPPILALTLSPSAPTKTSSELALPRISRHLHSIGMFGAGFGAVLPKWGGLSEVAQVACRAGAVGGGVYVLNKGIKVLDSPQDDMLSAELSGGEKVTTKWLVASAEDVGIKSELDTKSIRSRSITIVSSPLASIFPPTSEGGVTPAGAVVAVPSAAADEPPVYLFVHSSDSGECPVGQCVLYASVALPNIEGFKRLDGAVHDFLASIGDESTAKVLWSMKYEQHGFMAHPRDTASRTIIVDGHSPDLALEDDLLQEVLRIWQKITGEGEGGFLSFEARDGLEDEESGE